MTEILIVAGMAAVGLAAGHVCYRAGVATERAWWKKREEDNEKAFGVLAGKPTQPPLRIASSLMPNCIMCNLRLNTNALKTCDGCDLIDDAQHMHVTCQDCNWKWLVKP